MTNNTNGWKGQLAGRFTKEGAWAILSGVLLAAIGYTIWVMVTYAGPLFTEWVKSSQELAVQNAANVEALSAGQKATAKEYSTMLVTMQGLAKTQLVLTDTFMEALNQAASERDALMVSSQALHEAIQLRSSEHMDQEEQMRLILETLEKANKMMKNVPVQRSEEIRLLGEIQTTLVLMVEEIRKLSDSYDVSSP